ncbi:hypothetical protein CC85DRAFT_281487 [Cutaneotrichosporon oleaginosum]|uniref:Uncharacterized protein n=1 Tax=Cutaneotrichosporon oleaginosum TaxID=879819 RepID=A0A0J0XZD1_9TREE|nr:uncharacterized protein CC85DRAFT_281487 [Cutaneotrichosporon oleaginosum]KLT46393.1 hypothetical protein CC85DRAFT_281487 [Cutaneotrichosporon oleaginosum]TXT15237.1 hypothetical protein COLE_01430 [Cutaneotrichosporon oleaginosum]
MPNDSPTLAKTPDKAWNITYSESSWASWGPGSTGMGSSAHTTSRSGAHVDIDFAGTGIAFYGESQSTSYTLQVDGVSATAATEGGALASAANLRPGLHRAAFTLPSQWTGVISVNQIVVTTTITSEADSIDRVQYIDLFALDGGPINAGAWGVNSGYEVAVAGICSGSADQAAELTVPSSSAFLELWGPVGHQHGRFKVEVDPEPPNAVQTYERTAFNTWESSAPEILYFTPLDPGQQYTVRLRSLGFGIVCLNKARVYSSKASDTPNGSSAPGSIASGSATNAAGASTSAARGPNVANGVGSDGDNGTSAASGGKKSNAGAIAGGVVAGLAALAAIAVILFCLRRRKRNARSRQQAMYKATSSSRDRPGSWQPFFGTAALGSQGSRGSKDLELLPPTLSADKSSSRHTSMQTYDSTAGNTPVTPPVGEFGAPILPHDEVSKFTPTPYHHFSGSHTSIPSQSSLPPITEMPRTIPPGHSFATISTMGVAASAGTVGSRARSALSSPSSDTVDSLPPGWPSPPTSPPRTGPLPPPRKHMSRGSLSPPASPAPAPVSTMQPFRQPDLFD